MAEFKTSDGYTLEDIVNAVLTVLQPEKPEEKTFFEIPEEYVPKNMVKRYKDIFDYPEIMVAKEVQEYLRISEGATYVLLNHPKCQIMRQGKKIRIRREKLIEFLNEWEEELEDLTYVGTN